MNHKGVLLALLCLGLGLAAGAAGMWYWQRGTAAARAPGSDDPDAEDQSGHDDEDPHAGHDHGGRQTAPVEDAALDDHADESVVQLSAEDRKRFGVKVAVARSGNLTTKISLPGQIVLNADKVAHIVPRVEGIVRRVNKRLGDAVEEAEVMAILESRELAEAKSEDIAAEARLALAQANFSRAGQLQAKGISSEADYLTAKQQLAEAEIEHHKTEARLYALGLTADQVENVSVEPETMFTVYELKAPFAGTIVDKHISIGELVGTTSDVFTLADLSSIWVDISVYQKDLHHVYKGQPVEVAVAGSSATAEGIISFTAPIVDEKTRTALARVVLPNTAGTWRPGLFVSAEIAIGKDSAFPIVPKSAIQRIGEEPVIFLDTTGGFKFVEVALGRSNTSQVEVLSGLANGQRYVAEGAFELKAKIITSGLDAHAGHGH